MLEKPMIPLEAADFLQISLTKLNELRKKPNPPPCFMIGEQPRFLRAKLLEWLESQRR